MGKRIVVLCDGTSNEISEDRTNILRLFGMLRKNSQQLVFYDPGVGTFGAENRVSYYYRKSGEVTGLATGYGLDTNVKEAYKFILEHYKKGDEIYMFGFSRGAYTVRVLAGFIHAIGLLHPNNLNLLKYAFRAYKFAENKGVVGAEAGDMLAVAPEVKLYQNVLQPEFPTIKLLGIFDTVSSVIEFGRYFIPKFRAYPHTDNNPSVEYVRHAVAIDEQRRMFMPQLWKQGLMYKPNRKLGEAEVPQDVKEVWFSGVHGDVGGGYPENKSQLAKIALQWMIDESELCGLTFDRKVVDLLINGKGLEASPDPKAPLNKSMSRGWRALEYAPWYKFKETQTNRKTYGGFYIRNVERRIIPEGAMIHHSVFERDELPPNLPNEHQVV